MTHSGYHPVTQARLTAGIDAAGNVVGFHMRISGQSISASLAPERLDPSGMDPVVFQGRSQSSPEGNFGYQFQNILIDHAMQHPHSWLGLKRSEAKIRVLSMSNSATQSLKDHPCRQKSDQDLVVRPQCG